MRETRAVKEVLLFDFCTDRRRIVDGECDEAAREEVEDAAEQERNKRAAHDDDIVRHAEIGRGQVHKECGAVDPVKPCLGTCLGLGPSMPLRGAGRGVNVRLDGY